MVQISCFQDRIRDADVENRPADTEGKGEGGMNWETDMYISYHV